MTDNKGLIDLTQEAIIFYHVALFHGFRAAATHLGLSKSMVSSKVATLESRLGRKLLFRSTRDVTLTPEGEVYFESCRVLFAASQKLKLSETGIQSGLAGNFTISAPTDFMSLMLIPLLNKFQQMHPKLRFNLVSADQVMNLEKNKIDLAIRAGADGDNHLFRTPFMKVNLGLYCRPTLLAGKKSEKDYLDIIKKEGVMAFRPGRESSFQLNGKTESVQLQSRFQVHDVLSLKSLVMEGAGIGILPEFSTKNEVESGELIHILPKAQFKVIPFIFLSGSKRKEDERLNSVIEFLIKEVTK